MFLFRLFLLALLSLSGAAIGQDLDNYTPLRSQGPVPQDFTTRSSYKFEQAKKSLETLDDKRNTKAAKQDFLLESSFMMDQVLGSGRVLFNDPVSTYLGQLLDTILTHEPELRSKVRVYAVRSCIVNSFTTDDGIILVNLGLIAQLENEAQLAFILCHELAHFTESHIINSYVRNEEMNKGEGEYRRHSFDEKLLEKSRYSKEIEKEADRLGLERFMRTGYATSSLPNVYEAMRYAHVPFDDIPFDRHFFDREFYKVDDSYFLNRVRPIEPLESENPTQDSHPSPTERQQLLNRQLFKDTTRTGADHLVSGSEFLRLRDVCRFELSALHLKANRPVASIYNSFLLLRSYPGNPYLEKTMARALYMLSKFKSGGNYGQVHPGFSHIEGESQQVYHLFYRLQPEELCILATGHLWRLKQRHPNDPDLNRMALDLLSDLMMRYHVPGMFAMTRPEEGWDTPDTTSVQGKYDRLKQKSKGNPRLGMVKYALVDLMGDADFVEQFERLERERWGGAVDGVSPRAFKQKTKGDLRHWKNHGFALGAEKVVVVSPTYTKMDLRKNQQQRHLMSESAKDKFIAQVRRSADLLSMNVEVLDRSELDSNEVDHFNDIVFLNEWADQRFSQLDVSMVNMPQAEIERIIDRYGTEHFTWTGVINYRESKPLMYFYLLYALIPPAIPFAIYYLAKPNFDTYYYCITFNLRTGEPVLVNYNNYRRRDAGDLVNSSVYDSFWQMKRVPKNGE